MAASAALGVLSVGATVAQMNANSKAAKAEQQALEARAKAKREQADEILKRNEFNIKELKIDAQLFMSEQTAGFAKAGISLGTGITLSALEDTQDRMFKEIDIQTREAEFNADLLRSGADVDITQGQVTRDAARTRNLGVFLGGVAGATRAVAGA